ncbi:MAG: glycosyltransferase family 4 protein [Methanomicrobiales archaeon]|nr:glycosyltransferase family 4 protein [Methanomicrobiales archaeon]
MKILMLNYEYPPLGGGAANATYYLLREFGKRNDLSVDLVTSSASGSFSEDHPADNIAVYNLPIRKKSIHYWTMAEIISYSTQARSFIKKLDPKQYDLIHAFFGIPCGALAYEHRKDVPYIVSLRGSDVPGFNDRFSFQYTFLKPIIRRVWQQAAAVVANSEGLRDLAHQTDPSIPIDIIYNGIDTSEFTVREKRNDGRFIVLTVARLIPRKGIDDLIRAVPEILEKCPDLLVRIIGEGNLESELRDLAKKLGVAGHIDFLGYIPHDELPGYYATSDVFVLPSRNEGMSNTILEAMAAGLPIITTDTGGTQELISGNGQIIPQERPDAIAAAILQYISDSQMCQDHGNQSRVLSEFLDWKQVAEQYIKFYQRFV